MKEIPDSHLAEINGGEITLGGLIGAFVGSFGGPWGAVGGYMVGELLDDHGAAMMEAYAKARMSGAIRSIE